MGSTELGEQQVAKLVDQEFHARLAATGRSKPSDQVLERVHEEVRTICEHGLADLLLFAHEVGQFCSQHGIPLAARGSATASLVVWRSDFRTCVRWSTGPTGGCSSTRAVRICPTSIWKYRHSTSTRSLRSSSKAVFEGLPAHATGEFPQVRAIRVGVHVSIGARQAVRAVGAALGMEAPRLNMVARQVPLLSSPGAIENVVMRA